MFLAGGGSLAALAVSQFGHRVTAIMGTAVAGGGFLACWAVLQTRFSYPMLAINFLASGLGGLGLGLVCISKSFSSWTELSFFVLGLLIQHGHHEVSL